MHLLNLLACLLIGVGLLAAYRWFHRRSVLLAWIVALGILARAIAGLALFWVSYLRLPFLTSLQMGDGFWTLMMDARSYYFWAREAIDDGLPVIVPSAPSPFFTKTLAVWMRIVGVSGAAGLLLNILLYTVTCVLLARAYRPVGRWRDDLPLLVSVGAISLSPLLVIHATQPLKDGLFLLLIVLACVAARWLMQAIQGSSSMQAVAAIAGLCVAVYGLGGIRGYYPVILNGSLTAALIFLVWLLPTGARVRGTAVGVLALGMMWFAYWQGAGPYFRPSRVERQHIVESLSWVDHQEFGARLRLAFSGLDSAREGFVRAGGDTNIAIVGHHAQRVPEPNTESETADQPSSVTSSRRLAKMTTGLATEFVPASLLKTLGVVDFSGGRGLLPIADIDTLLTDASLLAILTLVYRRRRDIDHPTFVCFCLVLGVATTVLLGYVVTNLGTLFRMRYLAAAPFWMLALALHRRSAAGAAFATVTFAAAGATPSEGDIEEIIRLPRERHVCLSQETAAQPEIAL